jgi:hypothetical protein
MVLGAVALAVACNGILGIQPPNAVDASASDAPTEEGASAPDGADDASPDAPADAQADACVADLRSDVHNCGHCGHDCVGGACMAGVCQPVVVYAGGDTPSSIAVDGPTIYVTASSVSSPTSGHAFRCTTSQCATTITELANGLRSPWFAQLSGATLFWTNSGTYDDAGGVAVSGSVAGCATAGCLDAGPTIYAGDGGILGGLALDSTFLYWTEVTSGVVAKCATAGCTATVLSKGGVSGLLGVAVDSSYVYWTDGTNLQVRRCKLPSCAMSPEVFADSQVQPTDVAIHGGTVYWTLGDPVNGAVMSCPTSGCAGNPTIVASNQAGPALLAADDSGVYWTDLRDGTGFGTVMACSGGSCANPVAVATDQPVPFAIALDAVSVYFTTSTAQGAVMRVAKP